MTERRTDLTAIWIGMRVVDAAGLFVGTVKHIGPADPADSLVRPARLTVTGAGLMDNDCYVRAEQIALTDDDIVHLAATYGDLTVHQHRWT